MFKSGIFDFEIMFVQMRTNIGILGRQNEVFVFIDLGGTVWFFLFVSHLCVFDAGRLSPESVWPWRMGRDCTGNCWISDQYQYGACVPEIHAQGD